MTSPVAFEVERPMCQICGLRLATSNRTENWCQEGGRDITSFVGSQGSKNLNEHLRLYFVTKKLLKFSGQQSLKFISRMSRSGFGKQGGCLLQICDNCENVVSQAAQLYARISALQAEIDKLGETLRQNLRENSNGFFSGSADWTEERGAGNVKGRVRFESGALVKLEVNPLDFPLEFENEDGFQDEVFDEEFNDASTEHRPRPGSQEISAPPKIRIKPRKELIEDSDSDYNPGPRNRKDRQMCQSQAPATSSNRTKVKKLKKKLQKRWVKGHGSILIVPSTRTKGQRRFTIDKTLSSYQCEHCESTYTSYHGFRKHLAQHDDSRALGSKFDCPKCRHPNLSEEKLRRHLSKVHETSPNTCNICGFAAGRRWLHEKHMLTQHNIRIWTPMDGKSERRKGMIELNKEVNSPDVKLASATVASSSLIDAAEASDLTPPVPVLTTPIVAANANPEATSVLPVENESSRSMKCTLCDSIYTTEAGFKKHKLRHQQSQQLGNKFDCRICRHPNRNETALNWHMTRIHRLIDRQSHRNSGKVEPGSSSDKQPENENEVITVNPADLIKTDVEDPTNIPDVSSRNTISSEMKCEICGTVYTTVTGIRKHQLRHEQSKLNGNLFDCPICKHPNINASALRKHITRIHGAGADLAKNKLNVVDSAVSQETLQSESDVSSSGGEGELGECSPLQEEVAIREEPAPPKLEKQKLTKTYPVDSNECITPELQRPRRSTTRKIYKEEEDDNMSAEDDNEGSNKPRRKTDNEQASSDNDDGDEVVFEEGGGETSDSDSEVDFTPKKVSSGGGALYICKKCNVAYKSQRGFTRHQEEHVASISLKHKFDCECGFPASSEKKLRYHKKVIHQESTKHSCPKCPFQANRPGQLRLHLAKHNLQMPVRVRKQKPAPAPAPKPRKKWSKFLENRQADGKYQCSSCESIFSSSSALKKHMQSHEKSKQEGGAFECDICGYPCLTDNKLRRHKSSIHEKDKKPICTICNKTFIRPHLLRSHMQMHDRFDSAIDPTTGAYKCPLCEKYEGDLRGLASHTATNHEEPGTQKGSLLCPQCGQYFPNSTAFNRHTRHVHENIYKFRCEVCSKGFDSRYKFQNHLKTHEAVRTREFVCEVCGVAYSHQKTLTEHMGKFHPELQPGIKFKRTGRSNRAVGPGHWKCKWCHMDFPFKYLLVNHMPVVHKDMYTFTCDFCPKAYMSASSLRLHKEINHSIGPAGVGSETYSSSCKYCGKVFTHKHYAICHYSYCHEKKKLDQAKKQGNPSKSRAGELQKVQEEATVADSDMMSIASGESAPERPTGIFPWYNPSGTHAATASTDPIG